MNQNLSTPETTETAPVPVPRVSWWRRFTGCTIGLVILVSVTGCLLLVGFILLVQSGVSEVAQMGPWPGPEVSAKDLVAIDMSDLGLEAGSIQDARDEESWAGGGYRDGVLVTYTADDNAVLAIWALKYEDSSAAFADFGTVEAWAGTPGNCTWQSYAYVGDSGLIQCQQSPAYQKLFWNGLWIVHVQALEGTANSPEELVNLVRDALAVHWKAIPKVAS